MVQQAERNGGEKENARYADAELDIFGLARYRRHAVVHVGGETGKPVKVRRIRRR